MLHHLARRGVQVTLGTLAATGGCISVAHCEGGGDAAAALEKKKKKKKTFSDAQKWCAEALGTGMIVGGGCGTVCAMRYAAHPIGPLAIGAAFGGAVALAVYATRDISGAHLNPAITAAVVSQGGMSAADALPYVGAQMAGATAAAGINYAVYAKGIAALEAKEGIVRGAAGSGASFSGAFGMIPTAALVRTPGALLVETGATAALAFLVFAMTDEESSVPDGAAPALIGLTVAGLATQYGAVTGAGMNPARDLGPRLVTALTGWGAAALSSGWWVYTLGPVVGACAGGAAYTALSKAQDESQQAEQ